MSKKTIPDYFIPVTMITDDEKKYADFKLKAESEFNIKAIHTSISVTFQQNNNQIKPITIFCCMFEKRVTKQEFESWINSKIRPLNS